MENNLGFSNIEKIKEIEYYLFNTKYHLIDETFTFNETDLFNTKYLEKIHLFLFSDVYPIELCKIRENIKEATINEINKELKNLKEMLIYEDTTGIKDMIYKIWEYQIFHDGNTRTILCYLKILSNIFNLKVNYDFTKDIDKDYFIPEVIDSIEETQKIK